MGGEWWREREGVNNERADEWLNERVGERVGGESHLQQTVIETRKKKLTTSKWWLRHMITREEAHVRKT